MVLAPEGENASSKKAPIGRFLDAQAMVTALLCVLFAIMYLDRVNIAAAAASLQGHFSLTNAETGLIFSAFSWAYLGSVIFGGWGARKFGAKSTLAVCVVIVGVGTIATGLFAVPSLAATLIFFGFAMTLRWMTTMRLI